MIIHILIKHKAMKLHLKQAKIRFLCPSCAKFRRAAVGELHFVMVSCENLIGQMIQTDKQTVAFNNI